MGEWVIWLWSWVERNKKAMQRPATSHCQTEIKNDWFGAHEWKVGEEVGGRWIIQKAELEKDGIWIMIT